MSNRHSRRIVSALARAGVALACAVALSAHAAPPITVTSQAATDGPIRYTVRIASKQFGDAQDTRTLRSGDTDDFTWRTTPPAGAAVVPADCPDYASLAVDANGKLIRQTQVRLAPIVAASGVADIQLSFRAQAPRGTRTVEAGGRSLKCPDAASYSQVVHFSMPTNGTAKTVTLGDGTRITVSAQR